MHQRLLSIVLGAALLFGVSALLSGCDTAGTDTITLNTNTGLEPVAYTFRYSQGDEQNGQVTTTAAPEDDLDAMLRNAAGASRSDIVSARVTRVTFRRVSTGTQQFGVEGSDPQAGPQPKVFPYLSQVDVRLGGASGPLIASEAPPPVPESNRAVEIARADGASDVASVLSNGEAPGFLRLRVNNPDDIGSPFDEVEIEVSYAIEVPSP